MDEMDVKCNSIHYDGRNWFQHCLCSAFFFDRGIPDTLAYNRLTGLDDTEPLAAASAYRYNPTVFLFPPWEEIYRTDKERKQDFKQAVDTYHQIAATYKELGYEVMQVPFLSVEGRVDYICACLRFETK